MNRQYITENEKLRILNLHKGLIYEQEMATVTTSTTQPVANQAKQVTNYTVQQLQQLLNDKGYNVGRADNVLGTNTLTGIQNALSNLTPQTPKLAQPELQQTNKELSNKPIDTKTTTGVVTKDGKVTDVTTNTIPTKKLAAGEDF